ncbi:unnamed protein product [Auanema sp. JU1783]|nr:unnamed protein product [Auanema sp. JU1783]
MSLTYFGYSYDNPSTDITITMENGFPKLQPPCTTEPARKPIPEYIKELKWLVLMLQFIVLVAVSLIIFTLFLNRPLITSRLRNSKAAAYVESSQHIDSFESFEKESIDWKKPKETTSEELENSSEVNFPKAAVFSEDAHCSSLGRSILLRGGNAIDSAITVSFCISAVHPHKSGLGGGLVAVLMKKGSCETVLSRETAGIGAQASNFSRQPAEAIKGPRAVGIPGFLSGLFALYQDYASKNLSWKTLIVPIVEIKGIRVSKDLAIELQKQIPLINSDPFMRDVFINKKSRQVLQENDTMYCSSLADTLEEISEYEDEVDYFYKGGPVGQQLIKEIQDKGGFLTTEDLEDYVSEKKKGFVSHLHNDINICGPQFPSVYLDLQLALRAAKDDPQHTNEIIALLIKDSQIIGDSLFSSSLQDMSTYLLNDNAKKAVLDRIRKGERTPLIYEESDGSSSILIIDEAGTAVALTNSLGHKFGSNIYSRHGFFLNNAMAYFNHNLKQQNLITAPDHPNSLQPGKSPRVLSTPLIAFDEESIKFLTGGTNFQSTVHSILNVLNGKIHNVRINNSSPILYTDSENIKILFGSLNHLAGY